MQGATANEAAWKAGVSWSRFAATSSSRCVSALSLPRRGKRTSGESGRSSISPMRPSSSSRWHTTREKTASAGTPQPPEKPRRLEAREKTSELGHEEVVRIGRLLASAKGYRVLSSEGRFLGLLDHVRYERHSDHPDELVLRRGTGLWRRRRA